MTNIAYSIDWLKCTFVWDGNANPLDVVGLPVSGKEDVRSIGSYNNTVDCGGYTVSWHSERPEQRVMLQFTGMQLSDWRQGQGDELNIINHCIERGGRFTRIDFAIDLFDTGGNPSDVLNCWHCSQVDTIAKSVTYIEGATRNESKGKTLYIGSRQSERLIRVYEKGKRKRLKMDWVRVELECKGKRAGQFGDILSRQGIEIGGKNMLADVVRWTDIGWFNSIWSDDYEVFEIESIGRPETDRERWLRTVVVPVIEDELSSGNTWLAETLETMLAESANGHGPKLTVPRKV